MTDFFKRYRRKMGKGVVPINPFNPMGPKLPGKNKDKIIKMLKMGELDKFKNLSKEEKNFINRVKDSAGYKNLMKNKRKFIKSN